MSNPEPDDVVVIGAGLIGLATAWQLLDRHPRLRVLVIEKDSAPASQQSGHNSGVIHSGIYYKPGSFKARYAVEGRRSMLAFCQENEIEISTCGKLIVATDETELSRLDALFDRGRANLVEGLERIGPERAREIEPHVRTVGALWAPGTSVVDFRKVADTYAEKFVQAGGKIRFNSALLRVRRRNDETVLETRTGELTTRLIVNCSGLHSDVVAEMAGCRPQVRILPFRGEYYTLAETSAARIRGLIYPVPDPEFPFLGVHLTRKPNGRVEAGPNAVLATRREGYRMRDVSPSEVLSMLGYPGFWRLAAREWKTAIYEIHRSLRKSVFLQSIQRLVPEISAEDLAAGPNGVRAQAVARDGSLLDDFAIEQSENAIHLLNAPSPGATSSLIIGQHIVDLVADRLHLA